MADTVIQPHHEEGNVANIELKDNTIIVVLGASGDLAKKKDIPSALRSPPKQLLAQEYSNCRLCANKDGP